MQSGEWTDAIQFEKTGNNQGVVGVVVFTEVKQYFNRARRGFEGPLSLRVLQRENDFETIITNIHLPNTLRVDKKDRSLLRSNLLECFLYHSMHCTRCPSYHDTIGKEDDSTWKKQVGNVEYNFFIRSFVPEKLWFEVGVIQTRVLTEFQSKFFLKESIKLKKICSTRAYRYFLHIKLFPIWF